MKIKVAELNGLALDLAIGALKGASWSPSSRVPYSGDWDHGGVILSENKMEFDFDEDSQLYSAYDGFSCGVGETHLIAACRCVLTTKSGEEIEVPDEILALN